MKERGFCEYCSAPSGNFTVCGACAHSDEVAGTHFCPACDLYGQSDCDVNESETWEERTEDQLRRLAGQGSVTALHTLHALWKRVA